jgi:hypothetical protein
MPSASLSASTPTTPTRRVKREGLADASASTAARRVVGGVDEDRRASAKHLEPPRRVGVRERGPHASGSRPPAPARAGPRRRRRRTARCVPGARRRGAGTGRRGPGGAQREQLTADGDLAGGHAELDALAQGVTPRSAHGAAAPAPQVRSGRRGRPPHRA